MRYRVLRCLGGALVGCCTVLAQSTTLSPSSLATDSRTTTITSAGSVVSTSQTIVSSTSASADIPRPSANVTDGTSQELELWPPEDGLTMCEEVTFAFTGPAVPKTCGVYVTNTSTYIQQIPLGGTYTSLTAGTFSWLVDLPAGLSVNVQFWVTLNGAVTQFTLPAMVVQPSSDNSCLGTGQGQNTYSIISYASALNGSYSWSPPSATSTSKSSSPNVGAIAGGTVGGIALLLALVSSAYLLVTRRRRRAPPPPGDLLEDRKWDPAFSGPGLEGMTSAQMVAMAYEGGDGSRLGGGGGGGGGGGIVVPYQSPGLYSPPLPKGGFAAEPMPSAPSPSSGIPPSPHAGSPLSPLSDSHSAGNLSPSPGPTGTAGLADPATFSSRAPPAGRR